MKGILLRWRTTLSQQPALSLKHQIWRGRINLRRGNCIRDGGNKKVEEKEGRRGDSSVGNIFIFTFKERRARVLVTH